MALGGRHALSQVSEIDLEIDFLDRPGVLDGRAIHLVKARVTHGPQREIESGVEQAHWQASQLSGFSKEQAMVVLVIWVAGLERR
jgi:hypothetical protein